MRIEDRIRMVRSDVFKRSFAASQLHDGLLYFPRHMRYTLTCLLFLSLSLLHLCQCGTDVPVHVLPAAFIYTIIEKGDSLYFSTQSGEIFRLHPDRPGAVTRLGLKRFHPVRGLAFSGDNSLLAASYETGVHRVLPDTLIAVLQMRRTAWSMKIDGFGRIWLAGRQGVFRQRGDSLARITDLHEAFDVDFYLGRLIAAHREGVTLFDSASGAADTTFCKGIICWTVDVFDSLCIAGGVGTCALITNRSATLIPLSPKTNIPWSAARDTGGAIYLGSQKGLYRIKPGAQKANCIGFKGKCIKSLLIDSKGRLWVGRYFRPEEKNK